MKISAKNADHRARYEIYVDGINVSGIVHEADDITHVVTIVVCGRDGKPIRNASKQLLLGKVFGHVSIVSKVNEPAMSATVQ
jgi:hypothetical protein